MLRASMRAKLLSGAAASTYTLTTADGGHVVRSTVRATNVDGASQPTASSSTSAAIDVPAVTTAPHISGHARRKEAVREPRLVDALPDLSLPVAALQCAWRKLLEHPSRHALDLQAHAPRRRASAARPHHSHRRRRKQDVDLGDERVR